MLINKESLKTLIIAAGYSTISDTEINNLFAEIDTNDSGFVDVDEFMGYMYVGDKVNLRSRDTLL